MKKVLSQDVQENPAVRERLLTEALRLFTSRGYATTTVREIVEAAGVTKPVLYYYFNSKEGLYLEIMAGISQLFEQQVMDLQMTGGSVRHRLIHFFSSMFTSARHNLLIVKLAYSIYYAPQQGAPFIDFNSFFDRILDIVDNLLAEGVDSGELRSVDRNILKWALVGAYHTILEEQICRTSPRMDAASLVKVLEMILVAADPAVSGANKG